MNAQRIDEKVIPRSIRVEASAHCQLRCPSCPTASGEVRPVLGAGHLRLADFQSLLEANPFLTHLELSNYGEMFLNPQLLDIIRHAHEKKIVLHADNGVNLNYARDDVLEGLVKYRFRSITCSIDGASKDTYSVYRVRGNFDRVIANIQQINYYKALYRTGFPRLTWQFVIYGHNEHEIDRAQSMAADLGMGFYTKLTWDDGFSPIRNPDLIKLKTRNPYVTRDEYKAATGNDYMRHICHQLWREPVVNWDGKILGCCRNFWGDFGGNAFKDGLVESVNNERIRYARLMLQGRADVRPDIPCTTCDLYHTMKATGRWLTNEEIEKSVQDHGIELSVVVNPTTNDIKYVDVLLLRGDVRASLVTTVFDQRPRPRRLVIGRDYSAWFYELTPGVYTVCLLPHTSPCRGWRMLLRSGLRQISTLWGGGTPLRAQTVNLNPRPISQEITIDV